MTTLTIRPELLKGGLRIESKEDGDVFVFPENGGCMELPELPGARAVPRVPPAPAGSAQRRV